MYRGLYTRICLWTFLSIYIAVSMNESQPTEEWTDIIKQYSYICGTDQICDQTLLNITTLTGNMSCPDCSCDSQCRIYGNCCPDISFNTCVQTSYSPGSRDNAEMYYMKNDCPIYADERLIDKCQATNKNENILQRVPVTSKSTNMTYSNAYCAICNNDSVIIPWVIETSCNIGQSLFSSVDELWEHIKTKHCSLRYVPSKVIRQHFKVPKMCDWDVNLIRECNVTGTVPSIHPFTENACRASYQPVGLFQNPFCLFCNIQLNAFDPPISVCNVTGRLDYVEEGVQNACFNNSVDILRYPYKNEFCEECNLVRTESGDIKLEDAILSITSYNSLQMTSDHRNNSNYVYTSAFTLRAVNFSHDHTVNSFVNNITDNLINIPRNIYNQLSSEEFGWFMKRKWCRRAYIYSYTDYDKSKYIYRGRPCSCVSNCNTANNCCKDPSDDVIMRQVRKWSCIQTSFPRSPASNLYFMISKCTENYTNNLIKNLCESDNDTHYLSLIPVTDNRTSVTYKNYFCFLCVAPKDIYIRHQTQIVPWTVFMDCPNILNFRNEPDLQSILEKALSRRCKLDFLPNLSEPPKCMPSVTSSLYCSLCHNVDRSTEHSFISTDLISYRTIFSLFDNTEEMEAENKKTENQQCSADEIFNNFQGKCQKLSCFPGRVLLKGKCNVLISFTGSKIYNVAFEARVRLNEGQMELDKNQLFQNIVSFFTTDLFHDSDLKLNILEYYYQINEVCGDVVVLSESYSTILTVFMKIIIWNKNWKNPINQNAVEDRLYNATLKKGSIEKISFEYVENVKAWFLPMSGKMSRSHPFCITRMESINQYNSMPVVDITKLLFCPQISLSSQEFTSSNDGMQVFVTSLNQTFFYNEFFQDENNTVRICANNFHVAYKSRKLSSHSGKHTEYFSLKVLTILSTSISLISLFITFVVYCFLKKLRTIPGQNLMCFIGALFFAQLSFLLKDFFMGQTTACTALGILNYYFWVSIFTCSSVCCVHMFRVFVCDSRFYDNFLCNSTVIVYSLYAYLTPLLFLFISIGCHVSLSPTHVTGFGGSTCFIDDKETQLYSFILPISLLCFVNFILFSVTFHKIHSAPTMENTHCRNDLSIYLKLFLLTGTTWIFQIIDGLFNVSPFSYLVTILNGSQGFYIMISFVFNRRVRSLFEEKGVLDKLHLRHFKKSRSSGGTQLNQKITMSENVC